MKTFLATTATALVLSTAAYAETPASMSDENMFEASELIGMRVYSGDASATADTWEDIGEINDVLVTMNGEAPSAILGVGGLLGLGETEVVLDLNKIERKTDEDGEAFLVVGMTQQELEGLTKYEDFQRSAFDDETANNTSTYSEKAEDVTTASVAEIEDETQDAMNDGTETVAAEMSDTDMNSERDGYLASDLAELEASEVRGLPVYTSGDENIGEISDLIIGENGQIDQFIVDVGGFIGVGEKPVALTDAELSIMQNPETDEMRAFIDATEEELEQMPEYQG